MYDPEEMRLLEKVKIKHEELRADQVAAIHYATLNAGYPIKPCKSLECFDKKSFTTLKGKEYLWYNAMDNSTKVILVNAIT